MKYDIYQLKEDTMEQVKLRFMASDQAAQLGGIHRENYRRVYGGEIPSVPEVGRMLLRLFALFNGSDRPVDFSGHSMSVSDIVRLTEDGASSWWYCDPYGWMELRKNGGRPDASLHKSGVAQDPRVLQGTLGSISVQS